MSGKLSGHQSQLATPKPAISLSQPGLLQRTCACGGIPGLTGECEECSSKRLSGQRGSNPPALPNNPPDDSSTQVQRTPLPGFNFGKIAIAPKERFGVQAKLAIGQPGNKYEQEAERVAEQVMRMPAPDALARGPLVNSNLPLAAHELPVQKQEVKEEDEEKKKGKIQAKEESGQTPRVTPGLEEQLQASQGKGQPLPDETRAFMESRFGQDFGQVRVHTDNNAAQMNRKVNSQAFTHRQDVFFGAGRYSPESSDGKRLLAHELTHVIQQRSELKQVVQRDDEEYRETIEHGFKKRVYKDGTIEVIKLRDWRQEDQGDNTAAMMAYVAGVSKERLADAMTEAGFFKSRQDFYAHLQIGTRVKVNAGKILEVSNGKESYTPSQVTGQASPPAKSGQAVPSPFKIIPLTNEIKVEVEGQLLLTVRFDPSKGQPNIDDKKQSVSISLSPDGYVSRNWESNYVNTLIGQGYTIEEKLGHPSFGEFPGISSLFRITSPAPQPVRTPTPAPAPKVPAKVETPPPPQIPTPKTRRDVEAKIDLAIALLETNFAAQSKPAVENLKRRQSQLPTAPKALIDEDQKLDKILETIETLISIFKTAPQHPPDKPEDLKTAVINVHKALESAVSAVSTEDEAKKLAEVQLAYDKYLDAWTKQLISTALKIEKEMPSDESQEDNHFIHGYAQGGQIAIPGSQREWATYLDEVSKLRKQIKQLGNLQELSKSPLAKRLEFAMNKGDQVVELMHRSQALLLIHEAVYLGGVWTKRVVDSGQVRAGHVLSIRGLKSEIVDKLTHQLAQGNVPTEEELNKANSVLKSYFDEASKHIKELEEFEKRMELFVDVASTVIGARAMTGSLKALTSVKWFYQGGKMALRGKGLLKFALGSLAFTGASQATRAALTGKVPGATELLKQAGMDLATLGLLRGAHHLVGGLAKGASPALREGLQQTAAFGTLWLWSAGWQLATQGPEGEGIEGVAKTFSKTGIKTAIDLLAINLGFKLSTMPDIPSLKGESRTQAVDRILTDWKSLQQRGKKIGKLLDKWAKEPSKKNRVDRLAEEAQDIIVQSRALYDRMQLEGILTSPEATALTEESIKQEQMLINLRDASRLGIRPMGKETIEYRGSEANLEQYLLRLGKQGVVQKFQKIGERGVFRVEYSDGTTSWFARTGEGAEKIDFAAEALDRAAPKLDPAIRKRAFSNLKQMPVEDVNRVAVALEPEKADLFITWLAKPATGRAIAAKNSPFRSQLLLEILQDPEVHRTMTSVDPMEIQYWHEAPFEEITGKRNLENFKSFLEDVNLYKGSISIKSLADAQRLISQLKGTQRAGGETNPLRETSVPKLRAPGPRRTPYDDHWDYLASKGIRQGTFRQVLIGKDTWVLQFKANNPSTAWRFPQEGYPPSETIDVEAKLNEIVDSLNQLKSLPVDAKDAKVEREKLGRLSQELGFLQRIRGVHLVETLRMLELAQKEVSKPGFISATKKPFGFEKSLNEIKKKYGEPGVKIVTETKKHAKKMFQSTAKKLREELTVDTGIIDKITGQIQFGQNFTRAEIDTGKLDEFINQLEPLLKRRLQIYKDKLKKGEIEVEKSDIARAGVPGSHSEIVALDKALKARRQKTGKEVTEAELPEFLLYNRSLRNPEGVPPRCVNCYNITEGVTVIGND